MEEIFDSIHTREDCEALYTEILLRLAEFEVKYSKAEVFLERISEAEINYPEKLNNLKAQQALVLVLLDTNQEEEARENYHLDRLMIEKKLIKLEQERRKHNKYAIALKRIEMLQFQHNIKFLNKIIKLAQKRKAEL